MAQLCDDVGRYLERAERLCRMIAASDLSNVPLYLLRQTQIPLDLGTQHHYAYTLPWLDLVHRAHIHPWRGRGPCAVINEIGIVEDFGEEVLEHVTTNIVLHELAHMLDRPALYSIRNDASAESSQFGKTPTDECPDRLHFDSLVLIESSKKPPRIDLPLYHGHGLNFIRIVIHLAYRATLAGFATTPAGIFNGTHHGLSLTREYQDALVDEPMWLFDYTFREIARAEPPAPFVELWTNDMDCYSIRFPRNQENQT
jgi:hypothetical protein